MKYNSVLSFSSHVVNRLQKINNGFATAFTCRDFHSVSSRKMNFTVFSIVTNVHVICNSMPLAELQLSTSAFNFQLYFTLFTALTLTIIFITHLRPFTIKKRKRKSQSEEVRAQRPKERQLSSWFLSC